MTVSRIEKKFAALKQEGRAGLVTFTTAGDPDYATALRVLKGLPGAGADIIELGMPFSDPMADGPAIQASSIRALKGGMTTRRTLDMVQEFREEDQTTPIILMGYYNPVYIYGVDRFLKDALEAGVDGLIIVDLPPEEDRELAIPCKAAGMGCIHLATPTTDSARLDKILAQASGFLYYVSIAGITGTRVPDLKPVQAAVEMIRKQTELPVAVGFGIKTPENAAGFAKFADAVVVGSAIVSIVAENITQEGLANSALESRVLDFVKSLADGVHKARF
ncbi:tryptophan synthase subunit alpha [Paremcibacter congregatus]|uniref:Tryptophan synthase alpha chain n=1 Tax=Paremcibacter congregatus TaxID=2043170 RepID=A0A2G4YNN4_9PROT|nr:tryptophan synthase subunit alpha [Paremcibacter congregatus]PHZ83949.1 tryptophan synthase subunit alpha [Paremcibacter congregatus]QDE25960.1 tryptophan synthase subunit alpha [Paremcibacter congregatus]